MAKRIFQQNAWTPTILADSTALGNGTYMAIEASASTQFLNVLEIYEGGQAAASAINIMFFSRSTFVGTTPTALSTPNSDGPMSSASAALGTAVSTYVAASTGPGRSTTATNARLNLSFNSFGGIVRWVAAPGEEWGIIGQTLNAAPSLLSGYGAAPGAMGAHIVYEPY